MRIGFVGLGKLGLPCALAAEAYGGHDIFGFEVNADVVRQIQQQRVPYMEEQVDSLLRTSRLSLTSSLKELVSETDLIFVAVQTPHAPDFEGVTPITTERRDFDYGFLCNAMESIAEAARSVQRVPTVAVISTVLPGTIRSNVLPLTGSDVDVVYNPFFIAMGTTIPDFLSPEFVIAGSDDPDRAEVLKHFYASLHDRPVLKMDIESAEVVKVSYNTFIGMKIAFANSLMEICDKVGGNVDVVVSTLAQATDRLLSDRYLRAGMGDGGGCHPRDQIAMSFLARKLDLSYDLFESIMNARDRQTDWLASLVAEQCDSTGLDALILGQAYKPETNLLLGSPARLILTFLDHRGVRYRTFDPYVDSGEPPLLEPSVYLIGTRHEVFRTYQFPAGSIVIDPWACISGSETVTVLHPGRNPLPRSS